MEKTKVHQKLKSAIDHLYSVDRHLLKNNGSERSITHRLGMYLQMEFNGWDVDCEYNLDHHSSGHIKALKGKGHVLPDIIVHRRDETKNLLVIEVKKASRGIKEAEKDREKLRAYKLELGYRYRAFVSIRTGSRYLDQKAIPEWIE